MKNRTTPIVATVLFALFLINKPAEAALNLSVNPLNSSNYISFGRGDSVGLNNQEVRIRVTSSDGKPYQVFQRLIDPIVNDQGQSISRQGVETYSLSGSNSFGTLYSNYPEPLTSAEQLIYSSSPNGDSDNITLLYKVNHDHLGASGTFRGRIVYTVRSLGGSAPESSFLNILVEGGETFRIDVKGSSSFNDVVVKYDDGKLDGGYIHVSFSGNPGETIRVYQHMAAMPQNELLEEVADEIIVFRTTDAENARVNVPSWEPVTRNKTLLYESDAGNAEFHIAYSLNEDALPALKAGKYQSKCKIVVRRGDQTTDEYDTNFTLDVLPVFKLEVELPPEGIKFKKILPDSPPQEQELNVTVKSNLGAPYIVMQNIGSPLTNAEGDVIPEQYFTMKTTPVEVEGGKPAQEEYAPVPAGYQPIFFSDKRGSSAIFKVLYRLRSFPEIRPGDYSTAITYSLGEK